MSSRPAAGSTYTIVKGDTLWDISSYVYGAGRKYTIIWDANKSTLRSGDPNLIYPGEKIWVPNSPEAGKIAEVTAQKIVKQADHLNPDDFNLIVDGVQVIVESMSLLRTFDTCADGFVATIRDNILDPKWESQRGILKPWSYNNAKLYLGDRYLGEWIIFCHEFTGSSSDGRATLHGFSPSIDLVDSVSEPPYEGRDILLEKWIEKKIAPFGIGLNFDVTDTDGAIKRVKIGKTETVYTHLSNLVRQRGWVLSNGTSNNVIVKEAPQDGVSVKTFVDDNAGLLFDGVKASFDGRKRFRTIEGTGTGPRKNATYTATDSSVKGHRKTSFSVSSTESGSLKTAVEARKRAAMEEALTFEIPVRSWYNDKGDLFEPGQFVTYKSTRLFLSEGTKLLIKDVSYTKNKSEKGGTLSVIPPSVYTKEGEFIDPWSTE